MTMKTPLSMPARTAGVLVIAGLAVIPLAAQRESQTAGPDRPNVLFLIADDLNGDLRAYGIPRCRRPTSIASRSAALRSSAPTTNSRCAARAAARCSPAGVRTPRACSRTRVPGASRPTTRRARTSGSSSPTR